MRSAAALANIREFFLLREAERKARGRAEGVRADIARLKAAGDARLQASRAVADSAVACLLLKDAVLVFARGVAAARGAGAAEGGASLVALVPELPVDPVDGRAGDAERVRAALGEPDSLLFDAMPAADREATRLAFERVATALRRELDTRTPAHVRATRWGRIGAVICLLAWAASIPIRARLADPDIALGKPVSASSVHPPRDKPGELVDGRLGTSPAFETQVENAPSAVIDLLRPYAIRRVEVFNRMDGWFDDCLPLVVEASIDGSTYAELARTEQSFGWNPPWVIDGHGTVARYIRLRVAHHSYLTLSEVAVYGDAR